MKVKTLYKITHVLWKLYTRSMEYSLNETRKDYVIKKKHFRFWSIETKH